MPATPLRTKEMVAPVRASSAPVMEVFASIQGEGPFVGDPQVFVRLRGCPLRCRWCDTPGSWALDANASARVVAADGGVLREPGLATPFQVACWVASADPAGGRAVSVTGGEPLLWPEFVLGLRSMLPPPEELSSGRRIHLETAGGHPRALERVLEAVDHVSLDLKLPEDLDTPVDMEGIEASPRDARTWAEVRAACLELVRGRDAAAKIVVAGGRTPAAFDPLLDDLAGIAPDVPLVLQPATPVRGVRAPDPALILELVERARERGLHVRVLPQVHRALGMA